MCGYMLDYTGSVPKVLLELEKNTSGDFDIVQKNYYYGNRLVMSTDSNDSNRRYYIHDRLGSVRCVVDANALSVQNNYTYTPYGEDIASQTSEAVENEVRFAGYNYDDGLGQYYVWARVYSPYMARFNGYDPVLGEYKEPLTLHQYLYCWNDPVNAVDPDGRFLINDLNASTGIGASLYSMSASIGGRAMAFAGNLYNAAMYRAVQLQMFVYGVSAGNSQNSSILARTGVAGYTRHGLNQAISRDGGKGVSPEGILAILRNISNITEQSGGRSKIMSDLGYIVLNKYGDIITVVTYSSDYIRNK